MNALFPIPQAPTAADDSIDVRDPVDDTGTGEGRSRRRGPTPEELLEGLN